MKNKHLRSLLMNSIALHLKCPKCSASLKDELHIINGQPSVSLDIMYAGIKERIYLSSVWNDFAKKSTIDLDEGAIAELYCPNCYHRLISEKRCNICQAWMIPFNIEEGGRVLICSRTGCKEHEVRKSGFSFTKALSKEKMNLDDK